MRSDEVDAWMFLAVAHGQVRDGGSPLEDVIFAADWLNHAIPLDDELVGGLNRLIAAGLVSEHRNAFMLTPTGQLLHSKVGKRAGLWKQRERLAVEFASLSTPDEPAWIPPRRVLDDAITAYHKNFAAILRSSKKRRAR